MDWIVGESGLKSRNHLGRVAKLQVSRQVNPSRACRQALDFGNNVVLCCVLIGTLINNKEKELKYLTCIHFMIFV